MKIKSLVLICGLLLCATGCFNSKESLVCSTTEVIDKYEFNVDYSYEFTDDGKTLVGSSIKTSLPGETDEEVLTELEKVCDVYIGTQGIECTMNINPGEYQALITVDINKVQLDTLRTMNLEDITYDETKENLNDAGYTCK